jgi:DNA polymerase III subunit gamma/tau
MSAQALYRKWRPQLWEEVVGQDHVVQTLRNALRTDRVAHAYLFSGPRGCGKTTSARLVAKAVNCLHPDLAQRPDNTCAHCLAVSEGRFLDLVEIDGASNNGVENIRDLREKINFSPGEGRFKVYIIDEVHMLSTPAFNALLKTLEEPPSHAIFILATTEGYKIPATVSSRCQRFEFRRIPVGEIVERLKKLCEQEDLAVDSAALELVARQATGSLRDAISLLDQLVSGSSTVGLTQAQELLGASASQSVQALVETLATRDLAAGLSVVNTAIDAGADPRQMARQVVDYLRQLMLVRVGNAGLVDATADVRAVMARQAELLDVASLLRAIRAFNAAANDARGGWQPQLPLELALVECSAPLPEAAPALSQAVTASTTTSAAALGTTRVPPTTGPAATARPAAGSHESASRPAAGSTRAPHSPARQDAADAEAPDRGARPDTPAGTRPEVSDGDLKSAWSRLLVSVRERDKAAQGLLNSCSPVAMEDGVLRLSTNEFVYNKLNSNPRAQALIEELASQVFGFACRVRYEVGGRPKRSGRGDGIPNDGMVAAALDLGGEIVE